MWRYAAREAPTRPCFNGRKTSELSPSSPLSEHYLQAIEAMARRKSGPVDRLGAEELPHPGEVDFHQLRLQPNRLPIQRQGLPDIHLLRQPGQGVEVDGELDPVGIAGLLQERPGLGRVVTRQLLETPIPLRVPDPRPEGRAKLGVVTHDP